jgi:hypothetical protein
VGEVAERLRDEVDELVLGDNRFAAVRTLWSANESQRIPLNHCLRLVLERYQHFGDQVHFRPQPPRDLPTLIAAVDALPARPDAIEALWDGDTTGWTVLLLAITREPRGEHHLATIRHGGDLRLFNGTVPPWPEAREAVETGTALAGHVGVPFFFASREVPDDAAPRWWDSA